MLAGSKVATDEETPETPNVWKCTKLLELKIKLKYVQTLLKTLAERLISKPWAFI